MSFLERHHANVLILFMLIVVCAYANAQSVANGDLFSGIPNFTTQIEGKYDQVNPANGHIHFSIPLRKKIGKIPFNASLDADSYIWPSSQDGYWHTSATVGGGPSGFFTSRYFAAGIGVTATYQTKQEPCLPGYTDWVYYGFAVLDETGAN